MLPRGKLKKGRKEKKRGQEGEGKVCFTKGKKRGCKGSAHGKEKEKLPRDKTLEERSATIKVGGCQEGGTWSRLGGPSIRKTRITIIIGSFNLLEKGGDPVGEGAARYRQRFPKPALEEKGLEGTLVGWKITIRKEGQYRCVTTNSSGESHDWAGREKANGKSVSHEKNFIEETFID